MQKGQDPQVSVIWLVSLCRFAEAISIGMLLPVLPLFVAKLGAPGVLAWLGLGPLSAEQLTGLLPCWQAASSLFRVLRETVPKRMIRDYSLKRVGQSGRGIRFNEKSGIARYGLGDGARV